MDNCTHTRNVTIYADWQIWGDVDPREHMNELLDRAVDYHQITSYRVHVATDGGPFGVMYVMFEVTADFEFNDLNNPKKAAKKLLDLVVGDTDVKVRWVKATTS